MKRTTPLRRSRLKARGPRSKKSGGALFPKRRDYAYQRWVRGFPCWFCAKGFLRQQSPTEVEHLKTRGAGGDDFDNLLPTCARHRQQRDADGPKTFFAKFGDVWSAARQLTALYKSSGDWPIVEVGAAPVSRGSP